MAKPIKSASINIEGLDALRKELKKLDDAGLTDELKDANFEVAEFVVARARSRAASLGRMEAKAAGSLTAGRQLARAVVSGGGAKAPFFGGAEFGSMRGQQRGQDKRGRHMVGWNQFDYWTGNGATAGRFLYPAIRSGTDEIIDMYDDALVKITSHAFPD